MERTSCCRRLSGSITRLHRHIPPINRIVSSTQFLLTAGVEILAARKQVLIIESVRGSMDLTATGLHCPG